MRILTLIENNCGDCKILSAEHGLSMYIEVFEKKILFDTGQTGAFADNAKALGVSIADVEYLVLSHGHYDHSGGVKRLLEEGFMGKVLVGKGFFDEKYKVEDSKLKFIGNDFGRESFDKYVIHVTEAEREISLLTKNLYLMGNFEATNHFEPFAEKFQVKKENQLEQDFFEDEQVLVADTEKGLVIIVGCSHVGIVNIIETVKNTFDKPVYAIIGGSHLVDVEEERIEKTVIAMKKIGVKKLYLSHCTGEKATNIFKNTFGKDFMLNHTGDEIII